MKGPKYLLSAFLLAFSFSGFAQKVKLDDGIAQVDGQDYVKYEGGGMLDNSLTVYSMDGDELVYMQVVDPGQYWHAKIVFIGLDNKTLEMSSNNFTRKDFIKKLYQNKVIVNGKLDPAKVDIFISKYEENITGYKTQSNTTNTIIIKEEPKKSGININIGN